LYVLDELINVAMYPTSEEYSVTLLGNILQFDLDDYYATE